MNIKLNPFLHFSLVMLLVCLSVTAAVAGRADGDRTCEPQVVSPVDVERRAVLAVTAESDHRDALVRRLTGAGELPSQELAQPGVFAIRRSQTITDSSTASDRDGGISRLDVVTADDQIVMGSLCVGFDCVDGESFGFDTVRLKENNTRLKFDDTSATAGFPANDWQLTANDSASGGISKFSIEDVTGSKVPFTVVAGAPTNSIYIASSGNVGIGTASPQAELDVRGSGIVSGSLLLNGNLTEYSDANAKANYAPVDGQTVLARLAEMPVRTWSYKTDPATVRHMGPTAQDFQAAFGLGLDDRHIAPLDTNGVALAGVQELYRMMKEKDAQIARLTQQNAQLERRLAALEARR